MASPKLVRVRLCEDCKYGKSGQVVTIPFEYAEALIADKKATPMAENKSMTYRSSTIFKGGLDQNGR